jgi:rhodanese-related sulfurtransferase
MKARPVQNPGGILIRNIVVYLYNEYTIYSSGESGIPGAGVSKGRKMVFGSGNKAKHQEISAHELAAMIHADEATVIDVREAQEFAAGHIPGAINIPLSGFQPSKLPTASGKKLILNCQGGKRSALALDQCGIAQTTVDTHLAGGFGSWQAANLPVER